MIDYRSYTDENKNSEKFRKKKSMLLINNNYIYIYYYSELDKSVESDQRLFWHTVNKCRKAKSSIVCKLVTDKEDANSSDEISKAFADHFFKIVYSK